MAKPPDKGGTSLATSQQQNTMNIRTALLTLAIATSPVYAQQPAATPLQDNIKATQQNSASAATAEQLAERMPALALLPSKLSASFTIKLGDHNYIIQSAGSVAIGTAGDLGTLLEYAHFTFLMEELAFSNPDNEQEKAVIQAMEENLRQLIDSAAPLSIEPIYIATVLEGDRAEIAVADFEEGMVMLAKQSVSLEERPDGWKDLAIDLYGEAVSGGESEKMRQWMRPMFEGVRIHICYRVEGKVIRICICTDPTRMQWPTGIADSRLSDPIVQNSLPDGHCAAALQMSKDTLASLSREINSVATLYDQTGSTEEATDMLRLASGLFNLLSCEDLSIGLTDQGRDGQVRINFGLKGINFRPAQLNLPKAAEQDDTFLCVAAGPMSINSEGLDQNIAAAIGTMSEGFSLIGMTQAGAPAAALSLNILDAPAFSRICKQITGQDFDLSKAIRWQITPELTLTGKLDGQKFVLSSHDESAAALTTDVTGIDAYSGAVFTFKPGALGELLTAIDNNMVSTIGYLLGDLSETAESVTGTLCDRDGKLTLNISFKGSEMPLPTVDIRPNPALEPMDDAPADEETSPDEYDEETVTTEEIDD